MLTSFDLTGWTAQDAESGAAESGAPTPQWGLSAAKAARSAAAGRAQRGGAVEPRGGQVGEWLRVGVAGRSDLGKWSGKKYSGRFWKTLDS